MRVFPRCPICKRTMWSELLRLRRAWCHVECSDTGKRVSVVSDQRPGGDESVSPELTAPQKPTHSEIILKELDSE